MHTGISSTTKKNFQQALTVLLPSSHGGNLITRITLYYKYLLLSIFQQRSNFSPAVNWTTLTTENKCCKTKAQCL
jgi:hypothetical protein